MTTHDASTTRYQSVQAALASAIASKNLRLCYQGQNQLGDAKLVGLEALCRLHSDALGDVSPDEFIPIAEEVGLIDQVENTVLELLARDLPVLLSHHPHIRIGVNLSARHIAQPHFFNDMNAWLASLPTEAIERLDFEITETCFQFLSPPLVIGLNGLRDRGIRIVMDDFGSGQSSLSRLHTLPFDVIKLDKQFAQQIDHPMVFAIVKAAIDFTRQFNLSLVVEGVETQHQCQVLTELGAQVVQGFFFGKPAALTHWLT